MDLKQSALVYHSKDPKGKLEIKLTKPLKTKEDLVLAYTPGVAAPCEEIARNVADAYKYTLKGNTVAVISDGSAVLGLGNIGAEAAIPVMEGKAVLFKAFANIDAFPICTKTQNADEIVSIVKNIAPVFGGVNLEDISAPRCFEIEEKLQALGIPVMHDDQHGTAIVVLAALINAAKVVGKQLEDLSVVISGAGAAGIAIAKLLLCLGHEGTRCVPIENIILVDTQGAIYEGRNGLEGAKKEIAFLTNRGIKKGALQDVLAGADVFIGVSKGKLLHAEDIRTMAKKPIVFALSNPTPEIMPDEAKKGGSAVVGTGRSDFSNQINNVLAYPAVFRGALDARAPRITHAMKIAAVYAIAEFVKNPTAEKILPSIFEEGFVQKVADAVKRSV